ncbi:MAG TPA: hypothetical protein VH234_00290 [Candidatus Saccharimonadales bacterium]|jgi:hypothetical protein|nr:hypothetical protein [Candidatus Saccharimonadales bacterium]
MSEQGGEGITVPIDERIFGEMVVALRDHINDETGAVNLEAADPAVCNVYDQFRRRVPEDMIGKGLADALTAILETRDRPKDFYAELAIESVQPSSPAKRAELVNVNPDFRNEYSRLKHLTRAKFIKAAAIILLVYGAASMLERLEDEYE